MERALRALNFGAIGGNRDIAFALGVLFILTVLFAPLPPWALDLGLSVSLALAVLILMVALWIEKPLDFSSFPLILLVATILRLALNIASTRLILAEGHHGPDAAGGVIYGFSQFMIGGNFVIGLIVFAILIVINFLVITKGATRIAEVGARFTLDAIPGKQMAIDADLSAGLIDDQEARARRKELEDESAFYGSMDGASKFVRGDAIAGMIITFINIIGGIIIGVAQMNLPIGEAAASYTMLTVGDGLASQIPALVVSLAAGLLVAKGRNFGSADRAILAQLGDYPKALGMVAGLMGVLAFAPGLPFIPFALLGAAAGAVAYLGPRIKAREAAKEAAKRENAVPDPGKERVEDSLKVEDIQIEVGARLLPIIQNPKKGLADKVQSLRRRFVVEYGFLLPPVRIKDNVYVPAEEYRIFIQDIETARSVVRLGKKLVISQNGGEVDFDGEPTRDPSFGMDARWVDEARAEEAEDKGYTAVGPESVIVTHLAETIKDHLPSLLTYAALQRLIENLDPEYRKLLNDMVPSQVSMVVLQRVLQGLLAERLSIKNLPLIFEAVSEAAGWTRNPMLLVEHVRTRLARQISASYADPNGVISAIALTAKWETAFAEAVSGGGGDQHFAMAPSLVQEFITATRAVLTRRQDDGENVVILCSAEARPFVHSLLERVAPRRPIISHNELDASVIVKTVDKI